MFLFAPFPSRGTLSQSQRTHSRPFNLLQKAGPPHEKR